MIKNLCFLALCILCTQFVHAQVPAIAADIYTGSTSSWPFALTTTSGKLYFQAGSSVSSTVMDYTSSSGVNITTSGSFSAVNNRGPMSFFNGKLYYSGYVSTVTASRLFQFDTSVGGSSTNICDTVDVYFARMIVQGSKLYFFGRSNTVNKYGMYYVDVFGVVHLASYLPSSMVISYSNEMAVMSNKIFFTATTAGTDYNLFSFDTTSNMFVTVSNPLVSSSNVRSMFLGDDNKLYYTDISSSGGREIFCYSGSGTPAQLTNLNGFSDGINNPYDYASTPGYGHNVVKWGNKLFFSGCDGSHGFELMSYDLTSSTTSLIKDINPGSASSNPGYFVNYAGKLYFSADNGLNGRELWSTDGTAAGTVIVADTYPGSNGSSPWYMTVHTDGVLYFSADDGTTGVELFKLDITSGVTNIRSVKEFSIFPNPAVGKCIISIEVYESQKISVIITDNLGRIVASENSAGQTSHQIVLDFTSLKSDVYSYQVRGNNGHVLATGKIAH